MWTAFLKSLSLPFLCQFQYPIGKESEFKGVLDLIEEKALIWDQEESKGEKYSLKDIPPDYQEVCKEKREQMIETLAEWDEGIMNRYLQNEGVEHSILRQAIRKETLNLKITPVFCGSAFKNKGIQPLLSAVKYYLPSPFGYSCH